MAKKAFMRYTEADKQQARDMDVIDVISRFRGYTFRQVGQEYRCVEHNSLIVQNDRHRWYWNSQNTGGYGAIDWLCKIENYQFAKAVGTLLNKLPDEQLSFVSAQPYKPTSEVYEIYRLRQDSYNDDLRALTFEQLKAAEKKPEYLRYKQIYNGQLGDTQNKDIAEQLRYIYRLLKDSPPDDYNGQEPLKLSDVIYLKNQSLSYYIDINGFKPFQNFKAFSLPPRASGKYSNVFKYLTETRGISEDIILYCFKQHILYQDNHRNCVFVGYDENGEAKFASQRSTYQGSNYRPDVAFSDKSYSFNIPATATCDRVYVFESPIDLLSHATLNCINSYNHSRQCGTEYDPQCWLRYNRLSLSGASHEIALGSYLSRHPEIKNISCCLDNDETGRRTSQKIYDCYTAKGYTVTIHCSGEGKDYNDALVALIQRYRQQTKAVDNTIIPVFNGRK